MPNMTAMISRHNLALLAYRTKPANTMPPCNCASKPMKGQCRESSIIYKATLTGGVSSNYYGCSKTEFKTRFYFLQTQLEL